VSLLESLKKRRERGLRAAHRLDRERRALDSAIRKLHIGWAPAVVLAELHAMGMTVPTPAEVAENTEQVA
jgi:hypothetical protein